MEHYPAEVRERFLWLSAEDTYLNGKPNSSLCLLNRKLCATKLLRSCWRAVESDLDTATKLLKTFAGMDAKAFGSVIGNGVELLSAETPTAVWTLMSSLIFAAGRWRNLEEHIEGPRFVDHLLKILPDLPDCSAFHTGLALLVFLFTLKMTMPPAFLADRCPEAVVAQVQIYDCEGAVYREWQIARLGFWSILRPVVNEARISGPSPLMDSDQDATVNPYEAAETLYAPASHI